MDIHQMESGGYFVAGDDLHGPVVTRKAERLEDLMQASRMMNRIANSKCAPIEPGQIDTLLSRLDCGGSGPKTGCLILARRECLLVGFALLLIRSQSGLELTWLHAGTGDDRSIRGLWKAALETKRSWNYPTLLVRAFVHFPENVTA